MTDKPTQLQDQTRFFDEGMYFESPPPAPIQPDAPKFWATKRGKLTIGLLAAASFLVVVIGLAAMAANTTPPVAELPPEAEIIVDRELTETEKKVTLLKTLLKTADPTKQLDPFPPINLEIRLDPAER